MNIDEICQKLINFINSSEEGYKYNLDKAVKLKELGYNSIQFII